MKTNGYLLAEKHQVMTLHYVGLVGIMGVVTGWVAQNLVIAIIGSFLLGAGMSAAMPIWRDAETDGDRRFIDLTVTSPARHYFWILPIATLIYTAVLLVAVAARWMQ